MYSVVRILASLSSIQVMNWHENSFTSLFKQGNCWGGEEETLLQVREDPFPKSKMFLGPGEGHEGVLQSVCQLWLKYKGSQEPFTTDGGNGLS